MALSDDSVIPSPLSEIIIKQKYLFPSRARVCLSISTECDSEQTMPTIYISFE